MSEKKENCGTGACDTNAGSCKKSCNNCAPVVLILLLIAGVGLLAYMSGKMNNGLSIPGVQETATAEQPAPEEKKPDASAVLAKIDGEVITRGDVLGLLEMMPAQMRQLPTEQLLPMALEQEINNRMVSKKAKTANLENDKDVVKQLNLVKEQIVRGKFIENEVAKRVTEDKVKAEYDQYAKNIQDVEEVKAAHILVEDEAKAKELIKELTAGKDFAELAKANSKDNSAAEGGSLGYFAKGEVVPAFSDAAFSTNVGEYTKEPVKSDFGFHIIKVEDKRKRPVPEFDQAKPFIEQELRRKTFDELVKEWKSSVKIERFDESGNLIPEQKEEAAPAVPAADGAVAPTEAQKPAAEEKKAE